MEDAWGLFKAVVCPFCDNTDDVAVRSSAHDSDDAVRVLCPECRHSFDPSVPVATLGMATFGAEIGAVIGSHIGIAFGGPAGAIAGTLPGAVVGGIILDWEPQNLQNVRSAVKFLFINSEIKCPQQNHGRFIFLTFPFFYKKKYLWIKKNPLNPNTGF